MDEKFLEKVLLLKETNVGGNFSEHNVTVISFRRERL